MFFTLHVLPVYGSQFMIFGSWFIVPGQSNTSIGIILYIKVKERKEEVAVAELKLSNMTRSSKS